MDVQRDWISWFVLSWFMKVTRDPRYTRTCLGDTPLLESVNVAPSVVGIAGGGPRSASGAVATDASGGAPDVHAASDSTPSASSSAAAQADDRS